MFVARAIGCSGWWCGGAVSLTNLNSFSSPDRVEKRVYQRVEKRFYCFIYVIIRFPTVLLLREDTKRKTERSVNEPMKS